MAASLGSCSDEEIVRYPHQEGDAIVFGARAGFENGNGGATRTTYSGVKYDVGGKTYERIDWVQNTDRVQIYCPQAGAPADKTVDYVVAGAVGSADQESFSTLTQSADEALGLQWGSSSENHTFYAMYPSPEMLPDDAETTLKQGIKMDGTVVKGFVPVSQSGTIVETDGNYVVKPDMTYAYMVAKETVNPSVGGPVSLTFYPLVTALELTLKNEGANPILLEEALITSVYKKGGVYVQNPNIPIVGSFACDLSEWTPGEIPSMTVPEGTTAGCVINVPLWHNDSPISLAHGKTLTITVFLRSDKDVPHLQLGLQTSTGMTSKELLGIELKATTKMTVEGLKLPEVSLDYSKWMSFLPGNMLLKDLSIPGTGATFSAGYTGTKADMYKGQTLSFDEQWNAGIRAFEIISDRAADNTTSLGGINVACNGKSMGITVEEVLKNLLDKLASTPTETAVVMMTYQPTGVRVRDPECYMDNLKLLYQNLKNQGYYEDDCFVSYDPELTLADVQGKLMILTRPTQHVEDAAHSFDSHLSGTRIVNIDGCGTAKDKWGCRGYEVKVGADTWASASDIQVNGNDRADANGDGYYDNPMIENYILVEYTEGENTQDAMQHAMDQNWHERIRKNDMHFEYESNMNGVNIWCQEWQRVVPAKHDFNGDGVGDGIAAYLGKCQGLSFPGGSGTHHYYAFWHESYSEKVDDIKKTFDMAISGDYANQYLFINSLCGYYVTDPDDTQFGYNTSYVPYADDPCTSWLHSWAEEKFPDSSWPIGGMDGDIAGLAKDLNNMLYKYILGKSEVDFTGPTGLVYMNRVSNTLTTGDEGSYYLPGVIIANNFKHN